MHIGKRISILRHEKGFSQTELSKGIISPTHLSNIEAGRYLPSKDILELFAKKLGVKKEYLTDYEDLDQELYNELIAWKENIILDIDQAKQQLEKLHENYEFPIHNIYLECLYYLLLGSYYLKLNNIDEVEKVHGLYITGYLDDETIHQYNPFLQECYYYYFGLYHFMNNNFSNSFYYFDKMLDYISNNYIKASILYNLALINYKKKQIFEAITYANKAIELQLIQHQWSKLAVTYNLLGVLYWEKKQFEDSLKLLKKSEEIADLKNLITLKEQVYHNFGLVYKDYKDFDKAIYYFKKSIELKINHSKKFIVSSYYSMIGCYLFQKRYEEAQELINEAYIYCKEEKDYQLLNILKAKISKHKGDYKGFVEHLNNSIIFFEKHKDYIHLKELHEILAEFYFKNRKYKLAAFHYKKQVEFYKNILD
ncbi:MAG: helix-turn-helix transcriptional regulator [Bacillaceae bacterium]|nr:helix-turn-helix transcriptional regulator [Bacillaceae bacterium]